VTIVVYLSVTQFVTHGGGVFLKRDWLGLQLGGFGGGGLNGKIP